MIYTISYISSSFILRKSMSKIEKIQKFNKKLKKKMSFYFTKKSKRKATQVKVLTKRTNQKNKFEEEIIMSLNTSSKIIKAKGKCESLLHIFLL